MRPPPYAVLLRVLSWPGTGLSLWQYPLFDPMPHLRILGRLELEGPSPAESAAIIAQPKRVALLLYLSLAQPVGWQRRDTLLGLLWGELDEPRARNALSQALHHLRRGLTPEALPGQGTDLIRVDREVLECDAVIFEALARASRHAEALALYAGDLAPGLFVDEAPEFEQWLAGERRRLRDLAFQCATGLAASQERAGDLPGAIRALRQAVELHPEDEGVVRRLMSLLDRSGERGSALKLYEAFATRLRAELEADPSPETQSLARALRQSRPLPAPAPVTAPAAPAATASAAEAPSHAPPDAPATAARPRFSRQLVLVGLALAVALLVVVGMRFRGTERPRAQHPGQSGLAVAPFRLSGADTSLAYLREGMVDLLAARLGATGSSRPLDPRVVLAAWRDATGGALTDLTPEDALLLTGRLGADRTILGTVAGRREHLLLTAELRGAGGKELARASSEGPADSLPEMVDRLAAGLLLDAAGEPAPRFANLASSSLPALQEFLAGRTAQRASRLSEAAVHFRRALQEDSTFALAAMYLADVMDWIGGAGDGEAKNLALSLRGRLTAADQAYLTAILGPDFPKGSSARRRLEAWGKVVQLTPDRAEGWFGLGDVLHHDGASIGEPEAGARAREAFLRAVALDSLYAAPLGHLADQAFYVGDIAEAERFVRMYLAVDPNGDLTFYRRWRLAVAKRDTATLRAMRSSYDTIPPIALFRLAAGSLIEGVGALDGRLAAEKLARRAVASNEVARAERLLFLLWQNQGRFREAIRGWPRADVSPLASQYLVRYFSDGMAGRRDDSRERQLRNGQTYAQYVWLITRLDAGDPVAPGEIERIRKLVSEQPPVVFDPSVRTRMLIEIAAMSSCGDPGPGIPAAVARLDSLTLEGEISDWFGFRPLLLSHCLERRGELAKALEVLRRRPNRTWAGLPYSVMFFKEEGRLALATGDTAGARRAWARYVEMRRDPDPELVPERDRIAGLLARIQAP